MMLKAEDDGLYPSEAYILVPDLDNPVKWRMRLWESPELGMTLKQLERLSDLLGMSLITGLYRLNDEEFLKVVDRIRLESKENFGIIEGIN